MENLINESIDNFKEDLLENVRTEKFVNFFFIKNRMKLSKR